MTVMLRFLAAALCLQLFPTGLPAFAETMDIILISKPDKDLEDTATVVLIGCGYTDGAEVGMIGRFVMPEDKSGETAHSSRALEVEIHDVSAYVSACLIKGISYVSVPARSSVEFDLPELDVSALRDRAARALSAQDYQSAIHLLLQLNSMDSSSADSSLMAIIDHCRQQIEQEEERKLTRKERKGK